MIMETKCTCENLGIVIVAYNPISLYELLSRCLGFTDNIIVVDNNSDNKELIEKQCNHFSIAYLCLKKNLGIATAINEGVKCLWDKGIQWLVTFDQDSLPPEELIDYYNVVISNEHNIGLIGIGYDYHIEKLPNVSDIRWRKSHDQITSGLLHNMEMWQRIGGYKEDYFIDCVDFEYSLRASLFGFNTFTIENKIMTHSLGNPKTVTLLGTKIITMNHSSFRQYYIVRNHFWLAKEYFRKYPLYIVAKFYHLLIRLLKTVLFDDDRKEKICQICRGIQDGINFNK